MSRWPIGAYADQRKECSQDGCGPDQESGAAGRTAAEPPVAPITDPQAFSPPADRRHVDLVLSDGAYASLQWFALACMLTDHVSKMFPMLHLAPLDWLGRLAFPTFGFVLAAKLARNGPLPLIIFMRVLKRLLLAGTCATPFYILAFKSPYGWWPLNCLFLYAVFAAMVYILDACPRQRFHAIVLFVIGGAFVEYFWCGLFYCLTAWWYCKKHDTRAFLLWTAATALLAAPNGSFWALIALPVILAARRIDFAYRPPRHFFYVFYPMHLAALNMLQLLCNT